jgi:hypothetical protein
MTTFSFIGAQIRHFDGSSSCTACTQPWARREHPLLRRDPGLSIAGTASIYCPPVVALASSSSLFTAFGIC